MVFELGRVAGSRTDTDLKNTLKRPTQVTLKLHVMGLKYTVLMFISSFSNIRVLLLDNNLTDKTSDVANRLNNEPGREKGSTPSPVQWKSSRR